MSIESIRANWCVTKLDDISSDISYGYTAKSSSDHIGPRLLRITDIQDNRVDWSGVPFCEIDAEAKCKYLLQSGDLVFARTGATVGKSFLIRGEIPESVYASYLIRVRLPEQASIEFLSYFFQSPDYWKQITEFSAGIGQPNVNGSKLKDLSVPLPPLAEQKQIAAKLDELLAQVDTIKTRLDAIPHILKRFRQSVLAAAVSGRLTEEWREDQSVSECVDFDSWNWSSIPSSWSIETYSNVVDSRLGKMLDKAKNSGNPTKYLGNINVRWFEFDLASMQEILVSKKEQEDLALKTGDVLICEGGEPGRAAIWKCKLNQPVIFQKALHRARVSSCLTPEWLVINLKNDCDNKTIEQLFTGTTIKHLTGKALENYPIRLPPLEEQTEIVRRVEQLFAYADQIEQRVKDAQARVNHLTQSILAKAFRGDLTADWRVQNPGLISGDNSAAALLARIRAEREAAAGKPKTRKPRTTKNH